MWRLLSGGGGGVGGSWGTPPPPMRWGHRWGSPGQRIPGDPRGLDPPWGIPWAGQAENLRGGSREGRGRRYAPGPAGKGKGRPGEDLDGGQGVSRAGGEELVPGAGLGSPPSVPLPAPLWQLPQVPSAFVPVPRKRTVPRIACQRAVPSALPSPPAFPARDSPCVLALLIPLSCPEMSLTPAVVSRPRRPRKSRGDGDSEAREGRRRCQQ